MRKYGLLIALLLAPGCKATDGPEPLVTTTVQVTSTPTQISVNETAQASAIVKDQNGDPLTGKAIVWTSLNQGVATVSTSGVIRGISPGNATIQGTVDGVTGSATVTRVDFTDRLIYLAVDWARLSLPIPTPAQLMARLGIGGLTLGTPTATHTLSRCVQLTA